MMPSLPTSVRIFLSLLFWGVWGPLAVLRAQDENLSCEQRVERAEQLNAYPDQVIDLLRENRECFGADQALAVRRYKALAQAYLLQVPPEVDSASRMWQLLLFSDPEYRLDPERNPEELIRLSRRFTTRPLLSFELFIGPHLPFVMPGTRVGTENLTVEDTRLSAIREPRVSGHLGAGVWLNLNALDKLSTKWKRIRRWEIGAQLQARTSTYYYEQWLATALPATNSFALIELKERHTVLDLTLGLRHQFDPRRYAYEAVPRFRPFLQVDIQPAWLIDARIPEVSRRSVILSENGEDFVETEGRITGLNESRVGGLRHLFGTGLGLGAGVTAKIGLNYIGIMLRYHGGITNMVHSRDRYDAPELIYKYGYIDDDWAMDRLELSFSYWFTTYYPNNKSRNLAQEIDLGR